MCGNPYSLRLYDGSADFGDLYGNAKRGRVFCCVAIAGYLYDYPERCRLFSGSTDFGDLYGNA